MNKDLGKFGNTTIDDEQAVEVDLVNLTGISAKVMKQ